MTVDLLVHHGELCTPDGRFKASIAIDEGKIVGIGLADALPDATDTFEASDRVVLPGLVNTHVHFRTLARPTRRTSSPGRSRRWRVYDGARYAELFAITDTLDAYREKRAIAEERCLVGYNHWADATDPDDVCEIYGDRHTRLQNL